MRMNVAAVAVVSILFFSAEAWASDQADPAWTNAGNLACTKAAGRPAKVVPDWSVVDVEKCMVDCKATDGGTLKATLPDGAPCIKYMIVTPPPRPVKGKCSKSQCKT